MTNNDLFINLVFYSLVLQYFLLLLLHNGNNYKAARCTCSFGHHTVCWKNFATLQKNASKSVGLYILSRTYKAPLYRQYKVMYLVNLVLQNLVPTNSKYIIRLNRCWKLECSTLFSQITQRASLRMK